MYGSMYINIRSKNNTFLDKVLYIVPCSDIGVP